MIFNHRVALIFPFPFETGLIANTLHHFVQLVPSALTFFHSQQPLVTDVRQVIENIPYYALYRQCLNWV